MSQNNYSKFLKENWNYENLTLEAGFCTHKLGTEHLFSR